MTLFCECGHAEVTHWLLTTIAGDIWPCAECPCEDWTCTEDGEAPDEPQTLELAAELQKGPWPR